MSRVFVPDQGRQRVRKSLQTQLLFLFMKSFLLSLSLSLFAGVLFAVTLPEDEGSLQFKNEISATHDSNIHGRDDGESDLEFVYAPTLSFSRQSGIIGLDASVGGAFGFFADNDDQNYENFNSRFALTYPQDDSIPYTISFGGGYSQTTQIDAFLGDRIEVEQLGFNGGLRYNVNERWGFRVNGHWSDIAYDLAGRTKQETWGAGLDFIYRYSDKLDFAFGYAYAETTASLDTQDQTFRLQAEGELTPKITGTLGLGYQLRETDFGNSGDPYVNINLAWAVNERIEVAATGSIGFLTTSSGASGQQSSVGLAASMALGNSVTASAGVSYQETSYDEFGLDRSDEGIIFQTALLWQFNQNATFTATASYGDNQSDTDRLTYDRFRLGVGAAFTF